MKDTFAKGITWDLSDLYPSADSLKIEEDLKLAESKALQFKASYKPLFEGIIKNGIPTESARAFPLKPLLEDYKKIAILMTKPAVFAHLSFAAKTNDTQTGAFLQRIQTRLTEIQSHLLFFEVFWNKLEASVIEKLIRESGIKEEIHFLEKLRVYAPHTLSEGEENIMAIKANTSGRAFSRLFDEVVNNIPFYIEVEGKKIRKNKSEVLSLLHSQNRDERKKSSESLAEGLNSHSHLLTYI
jgi:oligoendopeptidase F